MESFPPRPLIFRLGIPWRHQGSIPKYAIVYLGGGFRYCFFSSLLGEMIQFDKYFSDTLKPPTSISYAHPCVDEPTRCNVPWQYEHDLHASSCSEAIIHNIIEFWILVEVEMVSFEIGQIDILISLICSKNLKTTAPLGHKARPIRRAEHLPDRDVPHPLNVADTS